MEPAHPENDEVSDGAMTTILVDNWRKYPNPNSKFENEVPPFLQNYKKIIEI